MIIYGSPLSPYVRKTTAFATEKGIAFEVRPAFQGRGEPDYLEASPFGLIPGLCDGDFKISDSTAIITYFDALKPDPNLIPLDPRNRARTIWYEEFADTIMIGCMRKMFFNRVVLPRFLKREGDLETADKAEREELPPLLDYIEKTLPASGYLVADRLTLADLAVASPFVNMAHMNVDLGLAQRPKLAAFLERIHTRPSFAASITQEKAMLAA